MTSSPILFCQVYLNPHGINMIKNENGKDLREAKEIRKRWHKYTEELYRKYLNDLDNHDDVVTHLSQTSWTMKSSGP